MHRRWSQAGCGPAPSSLPVPLSIWSCVSTSEPLHCTTALLTTGHTERATEKPPEKIIRQSPASITRFPWWLDTAGAGPGPVYFNCKLTLIVYVVPIPRSTAAVVARVDSKQTWPELHCTQGTHPNIQLITDLLDLPLHCCEEDIHPHSQ